MALPAQVRKQSEAVDKLYAELTADTEQAVTSTESEQEDVEGASQGGNADSAADKKPTSTQQTEQAAVDPDEEETFEKRYRSLQGMYNAEVPRLHAEKRQMNNRVQQLEQLIASMNAEPAQQEVPTEKLVTEQDLEDYGDSIEVMRRVFREEMSSKDAEINELKQLVRQVQGTVVPQVHQLSQDYAVSNEQRFWADLQTAVPDWQDINGLQEFQDWLLEVDPLSGISRQTYLDDAQRNMDAGRVANFFNAWKGKAGGQTARTPTVAQPALELERQVAPGKGRSGGAKVQGEAKTYTPEDIKKFFADVQKGRYRGKEAERNQIEHDIFAAQREGRIANA
jgi:hypothetical protein